MSAAHPLPSFPLPASAFGWARVRAIARLLGFCALSVFEMLEWYLVIGVWRKGGSFPARAAWLTRFCQRLLGLLGLEVDCEGMPAQGKLLVCNHLSYLDVVALAARSPIVFVAKRDVRSWPALGRLVASAGTIFVDRERRADVARAGHEIGEAIRQGVTVCLFAEGTSSDGTQVLPFRSSLLAPAVANGWDVVPAWIGYSLEEGSVADEVCYWGAMEFGPHFLNLLGKPRIVSHIRYGVAAAPGADRKKLAGDLRARVSALAGPGPAEETAGKEMLCAC
jgi:1-acyl-sn-glycerol-3-phosphate acyltransferase